MGEIIKTPEEIKTRPKEGARDDLSRTEEPTKEEPHLSNINPEKLRRLFELSAFLKKQNNLSHEERNRWARAIGSKDNEYLNNLLKKSNLVGIEKDKKRRAELAEIVMAFEELFFNRKYFNE